MKVNRVKYLKGPNHYSYKPTIWIELDIEEFEYRPSNTLPGFPEALIELIPTLQTHVCSLGYAGGFIERLKEGTWMGHILEHIALELQALAGIEVYRGKTITSRRPGIYFVTFTYKEPKSGYYAFEAAMDLVQKVLDGTKTVSVKRYVDKIADLYSEHKHEAGIDEIYNEEEGEKKTIVSITGTNGKTTTTRLVKHFLEHGDVQVGMTSSDGIYIGTRCIAEGDCSGPISARKILDDHDVKIAVLETARGGILREGLAFRYCDLGIVTNVSKDHLGQDGIETMEELVKLKRLIPEVVKEGGFCVLNADDSNVANMASHTKGKVIYTSLDETNQYIQQAIRNGNDAWFVDQTGMVTGLAAGKPFTFLPCQDIPITIKGSAKHNILNILQALAAAYALKVPLPVLKEKALSFGADFLYSRGRFNKAEMSGRTIIVDYAHNAAGLRALYETLQPFEAKRIITVLSAPGDRLNEDIENLAKEAARHSTLLIIKEHKNLRGRAVNEVPELLRRAALEENPALEQGAIVRDELEAFKEAWNLSAKGDIVLFLYELFSNVRSFFELHGRLDLLGDNQCTGCFIENETASIHNPNSC